MIAKNEEFYIPLRKLWYGYRLLFPKDEISLEEFEQTLREDDRFLFGERPSEERCGGESPEQIRVMESLGVFGGPYVSLKSRQPTQQDIARSIEKTFQRLLSALSHMWDARNPKDKSMEKSLQNVIAKVKALHTAFQKRTGADKIDE
jgi:hypothetical protein